MAVVSLELDLRIPHLDEDGDGSELDHAEESDRIQKDQGKIMKTII